MAKTVKQQAEKLALSATQVFDKAITDIKKANELLSNDIIADKAKVADLNKQVDVVVADIKEKTLMLQDNRDKLKNLAQFTTGK